MGAKKKRAPSPCQSKARVHRFGVGYKSSDPEIQRTGTRCECTAPWVAKNISKLLRFKARFSTINKPKRFKRNELLKGELSLIPCDEIFLHEDSIGTRKYKQQRRSKFNGCQDVEDWLYSRGLVNYELKEAQSVNLDLVAQIDALLNADDLLFHAELRVKLPDGDLFSANIPAISENEMDENLEKKLQGDGKNTRLQRIIKKHLKVLTPKQKKALNGLYLKNYDDLGFAEVAAKIGISIDSLKDRREQAFKKLQNLFLSEIELSHFSEIRATGQSPRPKAAESPLPSPIRHIKHDGSIEIIQVTKANPRPFGEIKDRTDVDVKRTKESILNDHLLKMRGIANQNRGLHSMRKGRKQRSSLERQLVDDPEKIDDLSA